MAAAAMQTLGRGAEIEARYTAAVGAQAARTCATLEGLLGFRLFVAEVDEGHGIPTALQTEDAFIDALGIGKRPRLPVAGAARLP